MQIRKQEIVNEIFAGHPKLRVTTQGVTPSWKRYGDGANCFEAWFSNKFRTMHVHTYEHSYGDNGRVTSKEVMLTLDEPAARQLYKMLGEMLDS